MGLNGGSARRAVIALVLLLLSATVLYQQVTDGYAPPPRFEVLHHIEWMEGRSELFNPWQYRVLPNLVLEALVGVFERVPAWERRAVVVHAPEREMAGRIFANGWALLPYYTLRVLLGFGAFAALLAWLRRVGVESFVARGVGVMLLAYAASHAHFDSGLAFSTYFDLVLYLLAAIAIVSGRAAWILPISVLAALNRETGALIPLMLASAAIDWRGFRVADPRGLRLAAVSAVAFAVVVVAVRLWFGWRPPSAVYGNRTAVDFLSFNLSNRFTLPELFGSFGFLPLLALLGYRRWKPLLRTWFWLLVPIWVALHLSFAIAREARLFLVPYAVVILPALAQMLDVSPGRPDRRENGARAGA